MVDRYGITDSMQLNSMLPILAMKSAKRNIVWSFNGGRAVGVVKVSYTHTGRGGGGPTQKDTYYPGDLRWKDSTLIYDARAMEYAAIYMRKVGWQFSRQIC